MKITAVTKTDPHILDALNSLLPQLSARKPRLSADAFEQILASGCSTLFIATQDEAVIGTLTLIVYRIPSRWHAWIEDVVVTKTARGQGVGGALVRHAIGIAKAHGARWIGLSSSPDRVAANRLYKNIGFKERHTNVYHFNFAQEPQ